jgi:hypothetical protein
VEKRVTPLKVVWILQIPSGMDIANTKWYGYCKYRLRQAAMNQRPEKDKSVGLTT